jgi:hypothetical protein
MSPWQFSKFGSESGMFRRASMARRSEVDWVGAKLTGSIMTVREMVPFR